MAALWKTMPLLIGDLGNEDTHEKQASFTAEVEYMKENLGQCSKLIQRIVQIFPLARGFFLCLAWPPRVNVI